MDLDQDGTQDMLSGSWPGAIYLFKGSKSEKGPCSFAKPVTLKDKDGTEINTGSASAVFATDWDKDGDLDLIVGSIDGWVWHVPNESGDKTLKFGTAVKVAANGADIHEHHSGPTVADWDGNGTLDLIVGQGDGRVVWYSNESRAGAPKLAAAQTLVAPNKGRADGTRCGSRVKPHVCDWNGDGQLDLLLGDFSMTTPERKELTEAQAARKTELTATMTKFQGEMMPIYARVAADVLKGMDIEIAAEGEAGMRTAFESLSDAQKKVYTEKIQAAVAESPELKAFQTKIGEIQKELAPLSDQPTINGNVWVLLRT